MSEMTDAERLYLESNREFRIHLRAWDDAQIALLRTLMTVAPFVDDLTPLVESLLAAAEQRMAKPDGG